MGCIRVSDEPAPKTKRPPTEIKLKKRESGNIKATMKRLKREMVEIAEQQQRIREGQVEVRKKFEEIDFECGQLQKETFQISQQAESNQRRLTLMFKILKARAENNFHEAARLTQSLRECMRSGTPGISQVDVDERGTVKQEVHCESQNRVTDLMTKSLKLDAFLKLRTLMGVQEIADVN